MPCERMVSPLQDYIHNNAESRGVAPCYNISPLQGFNNVAPPSFPPPPKFPPMPCFRAIRANLVLYCFHPSRE
ncbi:MAG: hypothetical protein ACR2P4_07590 [Gammaproteobacteria bacterium]